MVFLVFFGKAGAKAKSRSALTIYIPLITLAVLSIIGRLTGNGINNRRAYIIFFFYRRRVTLIRIASGHCNRDHLQRHRRNSIPCRAVFCVSLFLKRPALAEELGRSGTGAFLSRFWFSGWGFDWLYDSVIVRPYVWVARLIKDDVFDFLYAGIACTANCQTLSWAAHSQGT